MKYKMSDEFAIPWSSVDYQNHIADSLGSFVLFADMDQSEKDALCYAINNHDRLTEQVEELKDFAKYCAGMKGSKVGIHEMLHTITNSADQLLTRIGEGNE